MDPAQASTGEKIAAGSAVALFIALVLPWYGVKVEAMGASLSIEETANAWQWFSFIDILLFLAAGTVIAVVIASAAGAPLPVPPGLIMLGAGGLALLLVLFRLLVTPEPDALPEPIDLTRKFGIFIALLAAGGMAYGGFQASREV